MVNNNLWHILLECPNIRVTTHGDGDSITLLNSDDHRNFILNKLKLNPNDFRPDILHQSLLTILDSSLNKNNCLKLYVKIKPDTFLEINPICKIPRTFERFCSLFAKLIQNAVIYSKDSDIPLLIMHKKNIKEILPEDILIIGTSSKSRKVNLEKYISEKLNINKNICFIIGVVAEGSIAKDLDYSNDTISISSYVLSTSNCLFKIINAFEKTWDIDIM